MAAVGAGIMAWAATADVTPPRGGPLSEAAPQQDDASNSAATEGPTAGQPLSTIREDSATPTEAPSKPDHTGWGWLSSAAKMIGLDDFEACVFRSPSFIPGVSGTSEFDAPKKPVGRRRACMSTPRVLQKHEANFGSDHIGDDDVTDHQLGNVYDAFNSQSSRLELSQFMQITFYALCFTGSSGQLLPPDSIAVRVDTASKSFRKMPRETIRSQAVHLAKDCGVQWCD
eukprot:TRINITY_DN15473_c0_g1_i1.p2 TRINITY_DN15473_c0_g1~~TRINITY_DN15473_c0_g1_i1.p2  ORF type:complete len:228 (-),score=38.13 TRINITY_DN15473_c0_g1_i1:87-770(-)